MRKLAEFYSHSPDRLTERQVREYLLFLKNERGFAPGSMRVAVNGLKFFYRYTEPREWMTLSTRIYLASLLQSRRSTWS